MKGSFDLLGFAIPNTKTKEKARSQVARSAPTKKKRSEPIWAEVCKILPHYSVTYAREITGFNFGNKAPMPSENQPSGGVSRKAARRIGAALNWMILFSPMKTVFSIKEQRSFKFRINFITLTLPSPQMHSDHYIKQHLLAPFLKWMERSWLVNSYIWKAEAQENGNIHFHITTNTFIHWKSVRAKWNRLLSNHGYCKVFQDGTNDKGDAATEIRSVRKMAGIVSYIQGYITKKDVFKKKLSVNCPVNEGIMTKLAFRQVTCIGTGAPITKEYKRPIQGKLWSTSHNLSKIRCFLDMELDGEYFEARNKLWAGGKLIFEDKFVKLMSHRDLNKRTNHPLVSEKLRNIYEEHFKHEPKQTNIEIESFY